MKKIILLLALVYSVPLVIAPSGCTSSPTAQNVEVQTLKAVGDTADAAVALSAQLYANGIITAAQARQVADFYDNRFQPVFRLAIVTARADLSSIASPDVASLAGQLSALVISFQKKTP